MVTNPLSKRPHHLAPFYWLTLTLLVLSMVTACGDRGQKETTAGQQTETQAEKEAAVNTSKERPDAAEEPEAAHLFQNYIETGDLSAIEKRGTIRFVHQFNDPHDGLPRTAVVSQTHEKLARKFANELGLTPQFLVALTPQEGFDMLINGEADVITDNLVATEERREILGLSEPIFKTPWVLVTGRKGPDISDVNQLRNVELTVVQDSQLATSARELANKNPSANLTVRELPEDELTSAFVRSLDGNTPQVSVISLALAKTFARYRDDLVIGDAISEEQAIVWVTRKDATVLLNRINNFLTETLVQAPPERRQADWQSIKESGVLRFATYNGPGYLIWRGVLTGLDYELASKFAEKNELELQMIVVPDHENLIDYVKSGRADIAGASSTITETRQESGVAFSTPILETSQRVLSNKDAPAIQSLQDLNGRSLTVRAHSAFIDTAEKLRQQGIDVKVEIAPENLSFGDIIRGVADGKFDATLEDSNLVDVQVALYPQLVKGVIVSDPKPEGWMVAKGNNSLLKKVDLFLKGLLENKENRAMVDNYFEPNEQLLKKAKARLLPGGKISPFDELVKKYAREHNLDWRLVVAQMWQESNFDPKAESHVGAQGLLQVMPRTAEEMGFKGPLFDPEHSLQAGTKYLNWVRDRFEADLPADEKLWFTLAAYNAGIGHLRDARILAKELELDPNKWFDNVEVAMLKLSEPRYFEKARYGYARGAEPALYVRNIRNLYRAYTDMASGDVAKRWCTICAWWVSQGLPSVPPASSEEVLWHSPTSTKQPDSRFSPLQRAASP